MSPEVGTPVRVTGDAVGGASAHWATALQQVAARDAGALRTLRWAALIVLPPMAQTVANYCDFHLGEQHGSCFSPFDEWTPGIGCADHTVLEPWHLFWNSVGHGVGVLPAAVPAYFGCWNRLGRLTIMSLATLILLNKLVGIGSLDPRGLFSLLRMFGWQIATAELLLPTRAR